MNNRTISFREKVKYLVSRGWQRKRANGVSGAWFPTSPYRHVIPINRAYEIEKWSEAHAKN